MDLVSKIKRGRRKPNAGEMGIHEKGICNTDRKTFVIIISQEFSKVPKLQIR